MHFVNADKKKKDKPWVFRETRTIFTKKNLGIHEKI